jgi:hypothetical protein
MRAGPKTKGNRNPDRHHRGHEVRPRRQEHSTTKGQTGVGCRRSSKPNRKCRNKRDAVRPAHRDDGLRCHVAAAFHALDDRLVDAAPVSRIRPMDARRAGPSPGALSDDPATQRTRLGQHALGQRHAGPGVHSLPRRRARFPGPPSSSLAGLRGRPRGARRPFFLPLRRSEPECSSGGDVNVSRGPVLPDRRDVVTRDPAGAGVWPQVYGRSVRAVRRDAPDPRGLLRIGPSAD